MQKSDSSKPPARRPAERPHRLDERIRPRITVQVVDGKICCLFTPAANPGGPWPKP